MLGGLLQAESFKDTLLTHGNTAYPFSEEVKQSIAGMERQERSALLKELFTTAAKREKKLDAILRLANIDNRDTKSVAMSTKFLEQHCGKAVVEAYQDLKKGYAPALPELIQCVAFDARNKEATIKCCGEMAKRGLIEVEIAKEARELREQAEIERSFGIMYDALNNAPLVPCCR